MERHAWDFETDATVQGVELRHEEAPLVETPSERMAYCVWQLAHGAQMATAEVALISNLTWHGADDMLNRASRVIPITKLEGKWQKT